jgi:opacity protein-like surface antigen
LPFAVLCALAFALSLPAESDAQGRSRAGRADTGPARLEIGAFVGGLSIDQGLGSTSNIYLSVTGQAQDIDFGKLLGFRASWAFTNNVAAEFQFTRGENAYVLSVEDTAVGSVDLGPQFSADQTFLSANVVIQFPLGAGFIPYGTVGAGRLESEPKSAISGLDTNLSSTDVNFGGGVKFFIPGASWLGFRFDARYHTANDGIINIPGGTDSPKGTEVTIGMSIGLF